MNREELAGLLREHNQEHLLTYYDKLSYHDSSLLTQDSEEMDTIDICLRREKFIDQIKNVDWDMIESIHNKMNDKKEHDTKDIGKKEYIYEPLEGMSIKQITENQEFYYETGITAIKEGKIAAVLLAGGQGTRLGCDGPKGIVDIGITKEVYIFEVLIKSLFDVVHRANAYIPLYIMTSEKNDDKTREFFVEHNYFGYPEEYVTFFIQDTTPSVDYNGKLLMEEVDKLSLSPNGNGGWFSSMVKGNLLVDLHLRGVEWINVFAVDNVLQKIADPYFIGATITSEKECGAKVVKKSDPYERVGVLCLADGKPSIVEYYEMTEDMIHQRKENGELSYGYGVILNYLFRLERLEEIIKHKLPVHIVEKKIAYLSEEGKRIEPTEPNGYKFEELVLDMVHLFDTCLPYEVVREKEFAPIKNATGVDSLDTARELLRKQGYQL